jgi:hypothetical protein
VRLFGVVSFPSSLCCPKWRKKFGDLFYFHGYLPQRIVRGVCWNEALQEILYAVAFVGIEDFLNSCVTLLAGVRNRSLQSSLFFNFLFYEDRAV